MSPDMLVAAGRIIFGVFFVIAGVRNFLSLPTRAPDKTNYGWVLPAPVSILGFSVQVIAGLCLVVAMQTVWASAALMAFLVIATALFHNPLMFPKADRGLHIYLLLVNCTLVGGLLMVVGSAN
jgi:putative oxidoreductase